MVLLFLITVFYLLIPAVNAQFFNPIAILAIPTKEEKVEMEIHSVIVEINKWSI